MNPFGVFELVVVIENGYSVLHPRRCGICIEPSIVRSAFSAGIQDGPGAIRRLVSIGKVSTVDYRTRTTERGKKKYGVASQK